VIIWFIYNPTYFQSIYKSIFPTISARQNTKLILASDLNGYNHFYELVENSERYDDDPKKNIFNTMRIYWWQVSSRDQTWKENKILEVGESFFNEKYDLSFTKPKISKLIEEYKGEISINGNEHLPYSKQFWYPDNNK